MVAYPVRVPRKSYRGRKDNLKREMIEQNHVASEIESYINKKVEESDDDTIIIMYDSIAVHLGYSSSLVRDVLFAVDAGHNGITITKSK